MPEGTLRAILKQAGVEAELSCKRSKALRYRVKAVREFLLRLEIKR